MDMTQSIEPPAVVFKAQTGNSCGFNDLQDEEHYSFDCRCGCGELFAGYGKDIKSASKVEPQPEAPLVEVIRNETSDAQLEAAMKFRQFVSDRYIQKAIFKLTDDEIDQIAAQRTAEGKLDPVIEHGGGAEDNDPPEVGSTVYSRVTREGPYTVTDFTMAKIRVNPDDADLAQVISTWCGVLRTPNGDYISIPVGDLVKTPPSPVAVQMGPRERARATLKARRAEQSALSPSWAVAVGIAALVAATAVQVIYITMN
jgi:hypothetical protein